MDLILWRHADAGEPGDPADDDLARELTARGQRHAERMGEWLNRMLPHSARILVSPAVRARQTADALGRKYRMVNALAPDGSVDRLLHAARWPTGREPVLVVGHQPMLGLAVHYLMTGADAGENRVWTIRKGAVWWLRRRERHGAPEVILLSALSPDLL